MGAPGTFLENRLSTGHSTFAREREKEREREGGKFEENLDSRLRQLEQARLTALCDRARPYNVCCTLLHAVRRERNPTISGPPPPREGELEGGSRPSSRAASP